MAAYYNEFDKSAAQWLRNLIAEGLIAPGDVDDRSILDVSPDDLRGYTQHHWFAGLGGWSLALRRAGWSDDRPIWTASCPCQPFSAAGATAGFDDERHLWPSLQWLAEQCEPSDIIGEQVAGESVGPWIDLVHADLEALDYAFGAVAFPSAGVGATHIRDRLYWGAKRNPSGLADPGSLRLQRGLSRGADTKWKAEHRPAGRVRPARDRGPANGFWRYAEWVGCRDGKFRAIESGVEPLAHGVPARVVRVRAYGNAINVEAAAQFIRAYQEAKARPTDLTLDDLI